MDLFNPREEHQLLRATIRSFVQTEVEPQALEYDRKELFNLPLFRKLSDLGLLGMTIPEEYGGAGMDGVAAVIAHEEIASSDPGFCLAFLAHTILAVHNIGTNGSPGQKERLLPALCSGAKIGAMAMSEPDFGTDVLGMQSTAKLQGDHYILNGRKMWITNGTVDEHRTPADVVVVYARTGDKDGRIQISSFLVEKGMPGYSVGQKIKDKTGMRGSNTAELVFQDCKVPVANRMGPEGDAVIHMMRNLEIERVTLAAISLGIAQRCLKVMVRYSNERKAFGQPIARFGQIQKYISESYAEWMAARTYTYLTALNLKLDQPGQRLDSDGVKLVASTMAKNVADRAMQVLGGYGYVGEYVVERLWRDAKLLEIGGGTIEAHQKNISRELSSHFKI